MLVKSMYKYNSEIANSNIGKCKFENEFRFYIYFDSNTFENSHGSMRLNRFQRVKLSTLGTCKLLQFLRLYMNFRQTLGNEL